MRKESRTLSPGTPRVMKKDNPDTVETNAGPPDADDDVLSDPGLGSEERADWSDEGGATPSGPAEDTDDS